MNILCPVCREPLHQIEKHYSCDHNHSFDESKSGYLNLYRSNKPAHGDNKEMVKARSAFLESGMYSFLRERLTELTACQTLLDLACGEGYYTQALTACEKFGVDLSKDALLHASKKDKSTRYILASIFDLPFPEESFDTVLTCFAPFAKDEIERVLKKDGTFVFVTPGPKHLFEMKEVLYENPYENIVKDLDTDLRLESTEVISRTSVISQDALMALYMMTPYAYKTGRQGKEKLAAISSMELTAEFVIRIYKK